MNTAFSNDDQTRIRQISTADPDCSPGESVLARVMEEYLLQLEAGMAPNHDEFIQQYPEYAGELDSCLQGIDFVRQLTPNFGHAPDHLQTVSAETSSSQSLGDFRIVREIGRGGMGVVYEAEQLSIGRLVALKVLPFAAVLDHKQIERFRNEARAAGTLDHPNIVPVISVGQDRGVYYYAMSLIEGQSLAEVVEELKQANSTADGEDGTSARPSAAPQTADSAGASQSPLSTTTKLVQAALSTEKSSKHKQEFFRSVANLGIQAAEALHHAHERGVVHRDIKPANLLVDASGKLWVTDFGLAHLESAAGMTMTGDVVGTLRYMSPEQALGKRHLIDHRTDIYSLGVTLYELLVRQAPFAGSDRQELMKQIAFDEPGPLRKSDASIPVELETIVLKSMSKSPEDRYETAGELAADLGRFIQNKPILARPATFVDRAAKWARRNNIVVTAAALLLLVTTLGFAISTWQAFRATAAQSAARTAKEKAERQAILAEREGNISQAVRDFLNNRVLAQASPSKQLDPDITLREVLDQAARHIDAELANQPLVKAEIHTTISDSYRQLGRYEEALSHIERARDLFKSELGGDDIRTLSAEAKLGLLLIRADRVRPAVELLETTWATAQNGFENHPLTFEIAHTLAIGYKNSGRFDESRALFQLALRHRLDEFGAKDNRTIATRNNLAIVLLSEGRLEEAEEAFLDIAAEAGELFPETHPVRRKTMSGLAKTYELQGNLAMAEELQREVVRISESIFGRRNMIWATESFDLAGTLNRRGSYSEAIDLLNQIADFLKSAIRDDTKDRENRDRVGLNCKVHEQLSDAHRALWEYQQAFDCLVSAYEESERALGKTDGNTIRMLSKLVAAASRAEQLRGIETHVIDDVGRQIEELGEAANHLESPDRESVKWNVGLLALRNDQPEFAQHVFEGLIQHIESESYTADIRDRNGIRLAGARCNLGNALRQQEAFEAAIEVYLEAKQELDQALEKNPDEAVARRFLFNTLHGLASSYTELGKRTDAMPTWDAVIANAPQARKVNYEILKANSFARLEDYARASRDLEKLVERRLPGKNLINIAIGYCHCANAVQNEQGLAAEERRSLANQYRARAVALVKSATADAESLEQAYGLPRIIDELETNSDFDPIRDEPEFQASVDSLKSSLKAREVQPGATNTAEDSVQPAGPKQIK